MKHYLRRIEAWTQRLQKGTSMTEEQTPPADAPTQGDPSQSLPPEPPETDSTETASHLPPPTPESDTETAEQADARKRLKLAVTEFEGALEEIVAAELDPLAELHAAGFSVGGELPPVDMGGPGDETATALGHVPEGQLPPV